MRIRIRDCSPTTRAAGASCFGTGLAIESFDAEQTGEEKSWLEAAQGAHACESCAGHRLNPQALAVKFRDLSIAELGALPVDELSEWFGKLRLSERERAIATDLLSEIRGRLGFLQRVGLTYLSLDRAAPTLSGGETQRLRLAASWAPACARVLRAR
jgi:excinuclease ABC subunit A